MIVLKRYGQSYLAHLDRAKLADEGIETIMRDDSIVSLMPYLSNAFGGIKLLVYPEDAERANKILEINEFDLLKNVFDSRIDPQRVCPHCGSVDVIQQKSLWSGILFLILFFIPLAIPTNGYLCEACAYKWKEK